MDHSHQVDSNLTGSITPSGAMQKHSTGSMNYMQGMPTGEMMTSHFFTAGLPSGPLWFAGWTPTNAGTYFLACFGLFGLALFSRFLNVIRHKANRSWANSTGPVELGVEVLGWHGKAFPSHESVFSVLKPPTRRFSATREITLAALAALSTTCSYFLMLAVMNFNVYFFISIILGVFAGEFAFGRWNGPSLAH
ncbi:hypothetical protein CROQUDRAFT_405271 [Cronartium quercuum f. sp. fusiforme G11]|uniref:Copper transport protein n=1 Tax=Cronartium quercuum f. sp. fusiforme G11 TaxID=708437 RepID=A0A9P6NTH4_9BASI|nr:hypothetical protein CROQUDRAFT_405271 [Cronartium quercuum f. sp. fusiforme G11]